MKNINKLLLDMIFYSIIFLLVAPLIILVIWSFAKRWPWPLVLPQEFGLRGMLSVIRPGNESIKIMFFSILLSAVVTVITLLISVPASKALALYEFKGKRIVKIGVLAPLIVPTASLAMGLHLTFIRAGLTNTFLGVVIVHIIPCLPYGIRILTDVFEVLGEKMEMQARVLGATPAKTFFYVTLPLITPGLISAGSLIFIVSFSQYFLTFLIGGGKIVTFSMVMFPFIQSGDRAIASSYSLVFVLTTLIFLGIMEKSIKKYYKIENHFFV